METLSPEGNKISHTQARRNRLEEEKKIYEERGENKKIFKREKKKKKMRLSTWRTICRKDVALAVRTTAKSVNGGNYRK